jgi:hypothetical protein
MASQASQVWGIIINARVRNGGISPLNKTIASYNAISPTGLAAGVAAKKSNLFYVSQNDIKLLAPSTANVLPIVKKEIDSSDKNSFFKTFQERNEKSP